ncbi:chromosome segregation protein SMC [Bowmanella denitrificans]|uniref:chromosome segregation protein SMC n=1 Tax=Bowmanella denitrificans TaxID=366582 RepID=UPI000C9CE3AB|nr:chromosome segregation protein SMC [Bowmanella denitrificans]
MRLKKIKLAGFKSFVDPTSIPFPDDMTAIVGPNGCGKSNVIDAVRWVLGESSAKNLRGDAMTDVIFNGSTARKPVSQCSVELVFDNSSGRIQGEYAKYNELSIKRLVTRDGQSNYFLNASKCRRRDVTDLFLGTGLGPRSYAIIEQGMISRLIESKPQELRVFIEEAAGISKYKERRRETENRIRHCRDNLERLEDVRGELGQQLEKLQRQAAAAKRYKELKARERKLKSELAALRWLKHSEHINELEQSIAAKEAEIEEFIARQRGDERGMLAFQEQVDDLKQQSSDLQNQYFQVGNQISRLEQTQIHARQRKQQIEQELAQLQENLASLEVEQSEETQRQERLTEQFDQLQPELAMLEEQQQQANFLLLSAEQQWQDQQDHWRHQEQGLYQLKQQVQDRQSQIQSLQTMLERDSLRLEQTVQELQALNNQSLHQQLVQMQEVLASKQTELEQSKEKQDLAKTTLENARLALENRQQQQLQLKGRLHQAQASLQALSQLQENSSDRASATQQWLAQQTVPPKSAWQWLNVDPEWEKAVETAMSDWLAALVLESGEYPLIDGTLWLLAEHMTSEKPVGTLATKVNADKVPDWLTRIRLSDENMALAPQLDGLAEGESLINRQGHWLGRGWACLGSQSGQSGVLDRARQINDLSGQCQVLDEELNQLAEQIAADQHALATADHAWQQAGEDVRQLDRLCIEYQQQVLALQQQQQQQMQQIDRLQTQVDQQRQQVEEDQLRREELAGELEELQMRLDDESDAMQSIQSQRESLQQDLSSKRAQHDALRNRCHQMALQVQNLQNQVHAGSQHLQRLQQSLHSLKERYLQLQQEQGQWQSPIEEQGEQLQELLAQRLLLEEQQSLIHSQLHDAEEQLRQSHKGQQGIQEQIQKMRDLQQSLKLEAEGAKVRASAVLEQLQDMNQPLKPVLESLDEQAEENLWQQELDKTQAAVSRLGAVNLTAVEEYDIQAERKQHLDEQHEDLVGALDTLESAIRKIDKETRSRFRDTFDKVNDDLKMLFPKVFGGGAAYLELTDDDLLETGVTIMARPPGKKNSTIHLLSGGEKALTALSLVFAIFRLNPAPFCLLDEVDAPLDDANVGRFCKLVSEMSKTVQFIYITHNKIAMEMATHLTGVTMAEPGVSRMVAVDVDEAVALAEL